MMNAIREWRKDKTTIIVTHDFSNIRDEDCVFVMKNGTVARHGRMRDLRRTTKTRESLIDGWRITDDLARKQQQFASYIDRHFCPTETSFTLERPQTPEKPACFPKETIRSFTGSSDSSLGVEEKQANFPQPLPNGSVRDILCTVWPSLCREDRLSLVFALLLCLMAAATTPAFSFCLARLMGAMWSRTDKVQQGLRWALYLIGVAVTDGICTGGGHFLFEKVSQKWVDQLRQDMFGKALDRPKSSCPATRDITKQFSRCLDRNAQEMRIIVSKFLPISMVVAAILSISVVWAMTICWKLALVALSPLPLYALAIRMYVKVSSKWENRCDEAASDASATVEEILLNFSLIRVFGLGPYFHRKQISAADKAWRVGLQRAIYTAPWFGLYHSLSMPLTALIFYYATSLIAQDTHDLGVNDIVQVVNLLLFGIGTSLELLNALPQLTAARVAATELLRHADLTRSTDTTEQLSILPKSPLPVQMRNANTTAAQNAARTLRDLTCLIKPGSCVALVGSSGSGKTTMLSLLLGLTTPETLCNAKNRDPELALGLGGVPYSIVDLQHVRSKMAYVPQQPFLFPATIRDNIAYGISTTCRKSTQEVVTQAAQASGIHYFISSLPDGYDTVVGDGGQALSGGQAQLVNIARALASRPRLLVLDEPTSALDPDSASHVRTALSSLMQSSCGQEAGGMALVVATHSVEMMQMAAEVLVLDQGCKVEQGPYADLIASRGHLWRLMNQS
ncbi:hypothetical protein E4U41_005644 [Claviceps citrina]|nr:hypothetical protein E4U41_005644 [Claviceps citrina]